MEESFFPIKGAIVVAFLVLAIAVYPRIVLQQSPPAPEGHSLGSDQAPITFIEFSDYQSPYSRKFYTESFKQIKQDYIDTGKVRFLFYNFPLSNHPSSLLAAEAAECVGLQNSEAYWMMHSKIFEEQAKLDSSNVVQISQQDLENWAIEIGYDISACLESHDARDRIQNDIDFAKSLQVEDAPSFFINDRFISGAQQLNIFRATIESEL